MRKHYSGTVHRINGMGNCDTTIHGRIFLMIIANVHAWEGWSDSTRRLILVNLLIIAWL